MENFQSNSASTPFVSAPCSPAHGITAMSCSPVRGTWAMDLDAQPHSHDWVLDVAAVATDHHHWVESQEAFFSDTFDFSSRYSEGDGGRDGGSAAMSSADELFCNGQIRPLWAISPTNSSVTDEEANSQQQKTKKKKKKDDDDDGGYFDFRSSANFTVSSPQTPLQVEDSKASRPAMAANAAEVASSTTPQQLQQHRRGREGGYRRARSLSPLRVFHMDDNEEDALREPWPRPSSPSPHLVMLHEKAKLRKTLKDLLQDTRFDDGTPNKSYLKKREDRDKVKEEVVGRPKANGKIMHGIVSPPLKTSEWYSSKHPLSPHELLYTSQRAQAEKMRKRTFLPYKRGLLGCLGFSSKSYGSMVSNHSPLYTKRSK